jgi:hypothetical protein
MIQIADKTDKKPEFQRNLREFSALFKRRLTTSPPA